MSRTRIKFCGMTRPEDVRHAATLGVDAIGLVFTRQSPRSLDTARAIAIRAEVPPMVAVVALFMDDDAEWVRAVQRAVRPDLLQFHGSEDAAFCEAFATSYLKVVAMAGRDDVTGLLQAHPSAAGFLLDGHAPGEAGGSGKRFDWSRVPAQSRRPLVLAGGLDAGNVADAIRQARPWGVDVSSGIEQSPGIKDLQRMREFVWAVHEADRELDSGA